MKDEIVQIWLSLITVLLLIGVCSMQRYTGNSTIVYIFIIGDEDLKLLSDIKHLNNKIHWEFDDELQSDTIA